jgi:hypothetical protein
MKLLTSMAQSAGIWDGGLATKSLDEAADNMNACKPPAMIEYRMDGKFYRVIRRKWNEIAEAAYTGISEAMARLD